MKKSIILLLAITPSVFWAVNIAVAKTTSSDVPSVLSASAVHDICCKFNCIHNQNSEYRNTNPVPLVTPEKLMEQIMEDNNSSEEAITRIGNIVYAAVQDKYYSECEKHDIRCKFACNHGIG